MGVPKKEITDGVYECIHFYQLWKDIKGIEYFQTQTILMFKFSLIHDKQLFIALNNLDDNPQKLA